MYERGWGRALLGQSLPAAAVKQKVADWSYEVTSRREVGAVAGSSPTGLGRFFAAFDEPNDGTVAVAETQLAGLKDHIVLPVSHTGMLISGAVADQAAHFLRCGEFQHELSGQPDR